MKFTPEEIIAIAKEAGITFWPMTVGGEVYDYRHVHCSDLKCKDEAACIERYAALVAEKAAAKERERIFGAGKQLDGQMRLQLNRWEDGKCFAAAAHFNEEQTRSGRLNDFLKYTVLRLNDRLDSDISSEIRAQATKEGKPE